jgi:hypothetical protein
MTTPTAASTRPALGPLEDDRLAMRAGSPGRATAARVAIRADAVLVPFDFATDTSRPMTDAERAYWSRFLAPVG